MRDFATQCRNLSTRSRGWTISDVVVRRASHPARRSRFLTTARGRNLAMGRIAHRRGGPVCGAAGRVAGPADVSTSGRRAVARAGRVGAARSCNRSGTHPGARIGLTTRKPATRSRTLQRGTAGRESASPSCADLLDLQAGDPAVTILVGLILVLVETAAGQRRRSARQLRTGTGKTITRNCRPIAKTVRTVLRSHPSTEYRVFVGKNPYQRIRLTKACFLLENC